MRNTAVDCYTDPNGLFLASVVSGPGRNEIRIIPLHPKVQQFASSVELESDEKLQSVKWISNTANAGLNGKTKGVNGTPTRNKRKHNKSINTQEGGEQGGSYLAILLTSNEILIYSPFTKEFTNKISTVSPILDICDGSGLDIWGLDSENSALRRFSLFENRLQDSRTYNADKKAQFIQYLHSTNNIAIASCALHVVGLASAGKEVEEEGVIPTPKAHQTQIKFIIQSTLNPDLLAISRAGDLIVQIVSISSSKVVGTLKAGSNVDSIVLITSDSTETIAVVAEDGRLELFVDAFNKRGRKQHPSNVQLKTDDENVKFVSVIDHKTYLTGVWFDGYSVDMTDFELERLDSLDGEITINVNHKDGESDSESDESSDQESGAEDFSDVEDEFDVEFTREEPHEVYELILENLSDEKADQLISILGQNQHLSKSTMHFFSDEESINLFKQITIRISDTPQKSSILGQWLKWLLLSKGSLICKDPECNGYLKLVRSSLVENIKLLPSILSLQGRLALLQSQLKLRNDMMNRDGNEDEDDEDHEDDEQNWLAAKASENSVVFDGEDDGLNFEDEDGVRDADDHEEGEEEEDDEEEEEDANDDESDYESSAAAADLDEDENMD